MTNEDKLCNETSEIDLCKIHVLLMTTVESTFLINKESSFTSIVQYYINNAAQDYSGLLISSDKNIIKE